MSYHEKSAWITLVPILLVFVPYFSLVYLIPPVALPALIVAVVSLVVLLAILHTILALSMRRVWQTGDEPPRDEMEKRFDQTALKIAGYFLSVVVLLWCLNVLVGIPILAIRGLSMTNQNVVQVDLSQLSIPAVHALNAVQLLFAGFVLANVVYYVSLIVCYRRVA